MVSKIERLPMPPMSELIRASRDVLSGFLRPLHYSELARLSIQQFDSVFQISDGVLRDRTEDLREKVYEIGSNGFFYTKKPLCLVGLREWFDRNTLFNTHPDLIRIHIDSEIAANAVKEAAMRLPYLFNKFNDGKEAQADRIKLAFVAQEAVVAWVKRTWPLLYREPENAGKWTEWCGHDFKIWLPTSQKCLEVDVAGPGRDGLFGSARGGKPKADFHIVAECDGLVVRIKGFQYAGTFHAGRFPAEKTHSILRFIVFVNCEEYGYSYSELERFAL